MNAKTHGGSWAIPEMNDRFSALELLQHSLFVAPHRVVGTLMQLTSQMNLSAGGNELAPFLQTLQSNDRRAFGQIESFVTTVFDQFEYVNARSVKNQVQLTLSVRGTSLEVPLERCGTGVEQLLTLATQIVTSDPGTIILLDEPHSFLHPDAERKLMHFLEENKDKQFVIATHSAVMMKAVTLTVAAKNGFKGSVTLSATGLPSGVTAVFSPAATTSTSTVTFTASASALAGTYPITIMGVSGTLSSTAPISLTVAAPGFTLSASAATISVARGASGISTITVNRLNGFTATVALSATGLPSGVTAVFSPATATTTSSLAFTASSTATTGASTVTVTGTSGTLKNTITIGLTVTAPSFTLSFQPGNLSVPRGSTAAGTLTISALGGFSGVVTPTASGLPSGVTATFGAPTAGVIQVTFKATSTVPAGSFPITISGVSGTLKATASLTLTVPATTAGTSLVNLSPEYNINALVMDGIPFTSGGLDGGLNGSSTAYSANLVGVQQMIGGTLFYFGPADAPDAVSGNTVALPAGQFAALKVLATGVNGSQLSQVFTVTYTDKTVSTFTQNLSDWFTPQSFPAESIAMTMPYRDNGAGQIDNRTFYLYEYVFALNASKTVASVTLPNNRNVVALAATLSSAATSVK